MEFNTTEEIIQDIAAGNMVILLDDEDRENEGDLVCAAELVDDKKINFMISKAKGLVCLPLSPQKCDQLNLPMMTNNNRAKHGTGFTVSIEAAEGISTGISAEDRARTIIAAANKNAKAGDIVIYRPIKQHQISIKKGSLVVVQHPLDNKVLIVKRVHKCSSTGIDLRGDNEIASIDSRQFGLVNQYQLLGIIEDVIQKNQ